MGQAPRKATFGSVRKLPSGRFQARYTGPDGITYTARREEDGGPLTFGTKTAANAWLSIRQSEIVRDAWLPPAKPEAPPVTLREYANPWLVDRELAVRTRELYARLLRNHIYPPLGDIPIPDITPAMVRAWHAKLARAGEVTRNGKKIKTKDRPTCRAHAYRLLSSIMHTAVTDEIIPANPCRIRGAGEVKRAKEIEPASLAELETIVKAMPNQYQLMILLGAWCALRFGELAELRRSDIDLTKQVVRIRRGVVTTSHGRLVKGPKSEAARRPVAIPPHLMPAIKAHLRDHAEGGPDGLLFRAYSGDHLAVSTNHRMFAYAREAAGRPDLRFHDLRHTGAVLAASTGATLAELMNRLGHTTPTMALRYQHASQARDRVIADALSELVAGNVTPIGEAKSVREPGRKSG